MNPNELRIKDLISLMNYQNEIIQCCGCTRRHDHDGVSRRVLALVIALDSGVGEFNVRQFKFNDHKGTLEITPNVPYELISASWIIDIFKMWSMFGECHISLFSDISNTYCEIYGIAEVSNSLKLMVEHEYSERGYLGASK